MLVSHALPFRSVVLWQLDIWDASQTFASESSARTQTGYCGLSSPSFLSCSKKAHVKLAWRWSSLPKMRIDDLNSRRGIVAAVALSPGKTVESGITRDEKKALDHSIWIGAGAPSSISGNGSFAVALTVLPTQQGGLSNSSQNNGSLFLSEEDDCLLSAEYDTSGNLTKEKAHSKSREQYSVATSPERDVTTVEIEYSRRKKISEANKGRIPWNKGKKFPQGGPQSLRTAVTVERIEDLDESSKLLLEQQRRQRISQANKGKVPWNKGRKHSEETKQRIRARTTEAMKDPKIREKLRIHGEMQRIVCSPETKSKIRAALLKLWSAKRKFAENQESCLKEWKEMIAESARRGDDGDETHQWESYATKVQELRGVWKLSIEEERRRRKRGAAQSRKSRTFDHRTKIAEAIRAKWNDPNYRLNVQQGIHAHLLKRGIEPGKGRPRRSYKKAKISTMHQERQPGVAALDALSATLEEKSVSSESNLVMKTLPAYKNPLTLERLEKLRQVRASRLAEETKRREVTERARILMAEAKRAARALEAAAVKDKNALAPLLETRRLLAEAERSFETAGLGKESSLDSLRRERAEERWRIDALCSKQLVDHLNLQLEVSSTKAASNCFSTAIVNNFWKSRFWMIHHGMSSTSTNGMTNWSFRRRCTMGNS